MTISKTPWLGSTIASVWTGVALALRLRNGIGINPDGWAYWEASVSMLAGNGFHYVSGPPLRHWPPLYPAYLALWQGAFGVSGGTIALANIALAVVAAFGWSFIFLRTLANDALTAAVVVLFVSGTFISSYQAVQAHNLVHASIPLLLWGAYQLRSATRTAPALMDSAIAGVALTIAVLSHHSSLAFVPALGLVILFGVRLPLPARIASIAISCGLPVLAWFGMRIYLGQRSSHYTGIHASHYPLQEYLRQIATTLSDFVGRSRYGIGAILAVATCILVAVKLAQKRDSAAATYVAILAVATLFLLGMFWYVWINDPLGRRFLLSLALTIVLSAVCLQRMTPWPAAVLFAAIAIIAAARGGYWATHPAATQTDRMMRDEGFVWRDQKIAAGFVDRPSVRDGSLIVIAPPHPR